MPLTHSKPDNTAEKKDQAPLSTHPILLFLAGVYLIIGAGYQLFNKAWFPGFPIQIDGILGVFEGLLGRSAGLMVASIFSAALGLCLCVPALFLAKDQKGNG